MAIDAIVIEGKFGENPNNLDFGGSSPTTSLEDKVLSLGDGKTVEKGNTITVNYHGQIWGGDVFDSSFNRGSSIDFPIGVGMVIKGWDDALVGKTIGSRVLISIPPEFGYGERGVPQAGIGGQDTLVFVVDIIDAQ